jgi:hypothetical protein
VALRAGLEELPVQLDHLPVHRVERAETAVVAKLAEGDFAVVVAVQ